MNKHATASAPVDRLQAAYAEKSADYYEYPRPEMAQRLPAGARRVLDVGCGGGAFGAALKKNNGCEVWGVEFEEKSAAQAAQRLHRVSRESFETTRDLPEKYFDAIFFNDVLEHMVDPAFTLTAAARLLAPGGKVIASIPNIAFFPILWRLAVRGEWTYTERGTLDRTHLRFFTRSSIARLFTDAGYAVERLDGINDFIQMQPGDRRLWQYYRPLRLIPSRCVHDLRYLQFAVVAGRAPTT